MADVASCVYIDLSPVDDADGARTATYARAGHLPPLLIAADGSVQLLEGALSTPVGIANPPRGGFGGTSPEPDRAGPDAGADTEAEAEAEAGAGPEASIDIPAGATLVLYTDGLLERRDRGQREGLEELLQVISTIPPGTGADDMLATIVPAMTADRLEDDLCVLIVRNAGSNPPATNS
ncbi:hypothetical protein GCM10025865_13400 [Paraoerskovia sediminicola]|uniref:PPM-type phosphatase domain-containing protein n=2 Tax=Paraoerskovia sediminicola TaxID=1138587 RepID=A0ABN6XB03_9CELL|nr:hypothetical protein GCM10025865_13400 [Paraoerskovia sediminicola]